MYGDLTSNWFSTGSFLSVGDMLAVMYVSPGTGVSFDGVMVFSGAGGELIPCNLSVVPVPEPSTLALLACGLTGLLAYAWRKRK